MIINSFPANSSVLAVQFSLKSSPEENITCPKTFRSLSHISTHDKLQQDTTWCPFSQWETLARCHMSPKGSKQELFSLQLPHLSTTQNCKSELVHKWGPVTPGHLRTNSLNILKILLSRTMYNIRSRCKKFRRGKPQCQKSCNSLQ